MKIIVILVFVLVANSVFAQSDTIVRSQQKLEVIITATRSTDNAQKVPMSVSSVPKSEYEDSRGYDLGDALHSVAGVFVQPRSGGSDARITIRGFGARGSGDRSNSGTLRGIRVLVDGIPETEPDGRTTLDNIDLSTYGRVEVLRSNASSLYGSASGGVISLLTLTPNKPFVELRTTGGSFGFFKNSIIAASKSEHSSVFASFSNAGYDGYRDHSASKSGNANIVIRSSLDAQTNLQIVAGATSNIFRVPGPLTLALYNQERVAGVRLPADSLYTVRDDHRFNRVGRFGLTLDHTLGTDHSLEGTVYYQPRILTRSERNRWREFNRYTIGSHGEYRWRNTFSSENTNQLHIGFDQAYQNGTIQFYNLGPGASRSATVFQNKIEAASTMGFYLEDQLELGALRVTVGGRYDAIAYESKDLTTTKPSESYDFTKFTPKFAAGYALSNNHTVFASYGGGVEAPAFNEVDPPDSATIVSRGGTYVAGAAFNPLLKPATSSSIELGAKGTFDLSDKATSYLTYDIAGFMINVENDIIPWNGGAYYFTAGKTNRKGVEVALGLHTDIGLSARLALTAMKSVYDEYENQLGKFDGNDIAGLPGMFSSLNIRYDLDLGLYIEARVDNVGSYFADDRNDMLADGSVDPNTHSVVDAYTLFGATVGYKFEITKTFKARVNVGIQNLTDERYVSSVFINGDNNRYFEPGMPRNVVAGLSLNYSLD